MFFDRIKRAHFNVIEENCTMSGCGDDMDSIDRAIIYELVSNCRVSYDELGKKVGLSSSTVWRRVTELEEKGVIERYIVTLHPSIIGAEFINAIITLDGNHSEIEVFDAISSNENVIASTAILNRLCMVSYEAKSSTDENEIARHLESIPGVLSVDRYLFHASSTSSGANVLSLEIEFSNDEKEILRYMIDDPRISINELVERTGKSYRKVKKVLDDLVEAKKVRFGLQWNPNAKGNEMFILRMDLTPGIPLERVDEWLEKSFPENYWWSFPVTKTECMFSNFVFERIDQALAAKRRVLENEMVKSAELFFVVSQLKRARLPERILRELVVD